uniref:G-protein coupled receptors family 1 profile domain-containing protein n=1 Tax=Anolis carolinensis TaxID=28377 RepID=A0A803SP99_ANOCA
MDHSCEALLWLPPGESPVISAVMFSAGLVGNLWALALLGRPPFRALLSALVLTDLLGTCLLSPAVLSAYATGRTLVALDGGRGRLCQAFAFGMSFFALATLCCLGAMALERSLALGAPYLYARLLGEAPAWLPWTALGALYALCAALCAAPLLLGFGRFAQYCPGTWCFLQMRSAFALLYAALLLLLVLAVLLGNLSLMASLLRLRRRGKGAPPEDHLILLSIMTLTFAVCSLPFAVSIHTCRTTLGQGCLAMFQKYSLLTFRPHLWQASSKVVRYMEKLSKGGLYRYTSSLITISCARPRVAVALSGGVGEKLLR